MARSFTQRPGGYIHRGCTRTSAVLAKAIQPSSEPFAAAVFLHGFSDHCNRYNTLFEPLAAAGLLVHSFDQRGWGRSAPAKADRGVTGPREQYLADVAAVIRAQLAAWPGLPLFLMGHSMGGQGTLLFAARGPAEVRARLAGYVALAPWIQLPPQTQPSWLKLKAGFAAQRLLPRFQLVSKLSPDFQSHDAKANHDWDVDPLCHDTGTLEQFAGCLTVADELHGGKIVIEDADGMHLFLGHGTDDKCTSCDATKTFAERRQVQDTLLKLYEGSYHCSMRTSTPLLVV